MTRVKLVTGDKELVKIDCTCQKKARRNWQNDSLPWRLTLTIIKKQALGASRAEVELVIMNSYDNYLKFDQCDCSSSSSCKLPNGTRPDIDIGKYVDFWTTYGISLPYIILGFLLLIFTYVVVECFMGKQISMHRFILGPKIERNDTAIDIES